jgi:hypothetical protein
MNYSNNLQEVEIFAQTSLNRARVKVSKWNRSEATQDRQVPAKCKQDKAGRNFRLQEVYWLTASENLKMEGIR